MFLNRLDSVEQDAFISLAVKAAEANGHIADEEYQMIEEYCKEMGMIFFDARNVKSKDEAIKVFSASEEQHKRIVMLEILGLMYADGTYDSDEKNFVKEISDGIGISEEMVKKIEDKLIKYIQMTRELVECIG